MSASARRQQTLKSIGLKIDMRTSIRHSKQVEPDDLEPHRVEDAEDWTKNLGFGKKVQRINKRYGFKSVLKR